MMTVHLELPWQWNTCDNRKTCDHIIHLNESLETANSYPKEWVQSMFPNCTISEDMVMITVRDPVTGLQHNLHGPAVEYLFGDREWRLQGQLHRSNGPAIKRASGTQKWYVHGKLHRTDGPAVIYDNGRQEWWLHGKKQK